MKIYRILFQLKLIEKRYGKNSLNWKMSMSFD